MWNPDLFVAIKQEYLKPRERKVPVISEAQVAPVKEEIQSKDNDPPAVTSTDSANNNETDANNNQRKRKGDDRSSQAQGGGGKMSLKKRHQKTHPEDKTKRMCSFALRNEKCSFANCKYSHDLIEYLASKDPDIGMICPVYEAYGFCPSGIACRFGDGHIDKVTGVNFQRAEKDGGFTEYKEVNYLSKVVQVALRKRKYPNKGKLIVNEKNDSNPRDKVTQPAGNSENPPVSVNEETEVNNDEGKEEVDAAEKVEQAEVTEDHEPAVDTAKPVELKAETPFSLDAYPTKEKVKLVDFSNKVYVAPLTTVGNLPFRRILKEYGADITCGEMAMTNNLLGGQASEWALLRRHPCEDVFGIQIAGNHQDLVGKLCNVLEHETQSDFVDLNCGCPIDLVCNAGAGSGLLNRHNRLVDIFKVMAKNLPSRSVTVKVRIGWDEKVPTTHKLIPQLQSAAKGRLAAIFIHGRSRLQRYHKLANWDYVLQCARSQDPTKPLIPIIGNGDILSWEDWKQHQDMIESRFQSTDEDESSLIRLTSCAMIARGALIKPWLANEIKEQRLIDIPATERLDIVKKFCYYGLEHWGSDSQGVETTRRFLLEWLSFLHRYVPVGITEKVQRMNQRPLGFFGRSDLETLLSSSYCEDWIRISEMFLGKVKEDFLFIPKHKTNSYAPESESLLRQYEQAVVDPAASSSTIPEENPALLEDDDMLVEG